MLTGAIITIAAIITLVMAVRKITGTIKARKKEKTDESYNGFHLGEITTHDVPKGYTEITQSRRFTVGQRKKIEDGKEKA